MLSLLSAPRGRVSAARVAARARERERDEAPVVRPPRAAPDPITFHFRRGAMLIRRSGKGDLDGIAAVVNQAAQAYRGVIPPDRWHEPYMPMDELEREIEQGVEFWVAEDDGRLCGVMGIQDRGAVALVRHAYVVPGTQRKGVGTGLLRHVQGLAGKPILIGTWAAAWWAIEFYRRNGFTVVPEAEKERLLRTYWSIPDRQIETSVVLARGRWVEGRRAASVDG